MAKTPQEWLKQAQYDMETAEYLLRGGRNSYAVFMCHLSIEKALKALYCAVLAKTPTKTHDLLYLIDKVKLEVPSDLYDFMSRLNELSVTTRYPDELERILRDFTETRTRQLIQKGKEALQWLRERPSKL